MGYQAGQTDQGITVDPTPGHSIAIGRQAGQTSQGDFTVAIGAYAGQNTQHDNTIVLNATLNTLDSNTTNALFIKPIRGVAYGIGAGRLQYDATSGEITYSTN
jgi:hypothetical protein